MSQLDLFPEMAAVEPAMKPVEKKHLVGRELREKLWEKGGSRVRVKCEYCNCSEVSDYIPCEWNGEEDLREWIDEWKKVREQFKAIHDECEMKISEARTKVWELVPYLRAWMNTLVYEDFKHKTNGVELVKVKLQPFEIFITDTEEDVLSVCIKNKVEPDDRHSGWKNSVQIVTEVLWHYKKRFNTCVNGPWKLPNEEWLKSNFSGVEE